MYFALNMTWTHCEVYWDLDFEAFENEWRAASGIGGLRWPGFWLIQFFFSCIAGRVRDIVGQQRDENENEIKIP